MSEEREQTQKGGNQSENYQAGRDIIINKSDHSQRTTSPPDPEKLSALRKRLILSKSKHDLQEGLYDVEAILENNPKHTESRVLHHKFLTALSSGANRSMCNRPSRSLHCRSLALFPLLAGLLTVFLVVYLKGGHTFWMSLLIACATPIAGLLALLAIVAIGAGVAYIGEWWRKRQPSSRKQ